MEKRNNQMSLKEAAAFDFRTGQREKLTGWGKVCRARAKLRLFRGRVRRAA